MVTKAGEFIAALSKSHDVIVIGGLAVIAHGFSRPTKDADIWLEPMESAAVWGALIEKVCAEFPNLNIHTLPGWKRVAGSEIAQAADEVGMLRITGLDCPLDIFRRPNEFAVESFADVLSRSERNSDGTWLPDPLDLAISKDLTNREKDEHDIRFLESKVRHQWIELLPTASFQKAQALLERFVDWQTCEAALRNPDENVRELAVNFLREFAAEGDPFSQAILNEKIIPPP
jgi:hypothetical protein